MYDGPVRAGNRGGAGDFRWSDVVNDKQKDNYLGSTVNAPQGRWQKNKDIHWYQRDKGEEDPEIAAKKKREEIRKLREAEEDALSVALGFAPTVRDESGDGTGTGANGIKVERKTEIDEAEREERKADKELRKEKRALKRAERELRREEKEKERAERRGSSSRYDDDRDRDRDRDRHRSRRGRDDSDDDSDEERYRHRRRDERERERGENSRRHDDHDEDDRRGHRHDRDMDRAGGVQRRRDGSESRTRLRSPKRERDRERERRRDVSRTPEYVKKERSVSPRRRP